MLSIRNDVRAMVWAHCRYEPRRTCSDWRDPSHALMLRFLSSGKVASKRFGFNGSNPETFRDVCGQAVKAAEAHMVSLGLGFESRF
jgi:hypothetical protein